MVNADSYLNTRETERLVIEKITKDDIVPWAEFFTSTEATRYLRSYGNKTPAECSEEMLTKQLTRYAENKYGLMKLTDKKTKQFIGLCGLLTQTIHQDEEMEIGYQVFPKFWNKGYATEAAKAFRNFAFENKLADTIISIIHINNIASQKVALKNGMTNEKQTSYIGLDVFIYRITMEQWKKL